MYPLRLLSMVIKTFHCPSLFIYLHCTGIAHLFFNADNEMASSKAKRQRATEDEEYEKTWLQRFTEESALRLLKSYESFFLKRGQFKTSTECQLLMLKSIYFSFHCQNKLNLTVEIVTKHTHTHTYTSFFIVLVCNCIFLLIALSQETFEHFIKL